MLCSSPNLLYCEIAPRTIRERDYAALLVLKESLGMMLHMLEHTCMQSEAWLIGAVTAYLTYDSVESA